MTGESFLPVEEAEPGADPDPRLAREWPLVASVVESAYRNTGTEHDQQAVLALGAVPEKGSKLTVDS